MEAASILHALELHRATEYVDAFHMAILRRELGQVDEAFDELERAGRENSAWLYSLNVDPKIDPFREDARYERLRGRIFGRYVGKGTAAS